LYNIGGLKSGSKRVHKVLPSPFTGTMIIVSAAFGIIMPFSILTLLVQVVGDIYLLIGFACLLVGPILIMFNSAKYEKGQGKVIDILGLVFNIVGLVFLLVWAMNVLKVLEDIYANVDLKFFGGNRYWFLVGKLIAVLANTYFMTVMWTDIIVYANILQYYWGDVNSLIFLWNNGFYSTDVKQESDAKLSSLSKLVK